MLGYRAQVRGGRRGADTAARRPATVLSVTHEGMLVQFDDAHQGLLELEVGVAHV